MREPIKTHTFCFNPSDGGDEALTLRTKFFNSDYGESNIFTNQELVLQSCCNAASIQLYGAAISPDQLRQLANELEKAKLEAERALQTKKE